MFNFKSFENDMKQVIELLKKHSNNIMIDECYDCDDYALLKKILYYYIELLSHDIRLENILSKLDDVYDMFYYLLKDRIKYELIDIVCNNNQIIHSIANIALERLKSDHLLRDFDITNYKVKSNKDKDYIYYSVFDENNNVIGGFTIKRLTIIRNYKDGCC